MLIYQPPIEDYAFLLEHWLGAPADWSTMPSFSALDTDTVRQVLDEAGRFATDVLLPLNAPGDAQGCHFDNGGVHTPRGYREAYRSFVGGGWPALACAQEFGGQGLPQSLTCALYEMLNATCHGWTMYPGLAHGAYECLRAHANADLQQRYLPNLVSGEWLATMCLTESTAGSDVGLLRTRAEPGTDFERDGSCLLTGTKIFISGGEHDLSENILHLVLARLPDAPVGSRGISLFLVPKRIPNNAGGLDPNAVRCLGIEHKMGLKGSATCTMVFERARGWLIGAPNCGLAAMFVMMNAARLQVALQGLAHADIAHQNALRYAQQRRQSRAPGRPAAATAAADLIINHLPIQRLLLEQRALVQGERALGLWIAHLLDIAEHHDNTKRRAQSSRWASVLTPIAKALFTANGFRLSSTALQVFGGYGYIQDTGLEQLVRDSRIAMIYEGTNEIQAIDLIHRKVLGDRGSVTNEVLDLLSGEATQCEALPPIAHLGQRLAQIVNDFRTTVNDLVAADQGSVDLSQRVSTDFLSAMSWVLLAYVWARSARVALGLSTDHPLRREKLEISQYFFTFLLPDFERYLRMVHVTASTEINYSWDHSQA